MYLTYSLHPTLLIALEQTLSNPLLGSEHHWEYVTTSSTGELPLCFPMMIDTTVLTIMTLMRKKRVILQQIICQTMRHQVPSDSPLIHAMIR